MKKLIGLLGFAVILSFGMATLSFAGGDKAKTGEKAAADKMAAPDSQTVKGDVLKIEGEFYTVKDMAGKEVRLHVDETSKLEGTFKAGDKIEAQASKKGHALSIKHADPAAK